MENLTINLPAGATPVQLQKGGGYIEILSSYGPIGINLYGLQQGMTNSMSGAESGQFMAADFSALEIVNQYGVAQQIKVLICDRGEKGGSRRQPGNVRVIDDARSRTQAETAFMASGLIATGADQTGHLILSNPAATSKRLVVSSFGFSALTSAGSSFVSLHVGQSPTLTGDTFVRNPASKRILNGASPAASVGELRSLSSATVLPGLTNVQAMVVQAPSTGVMKEIQLKEPITLAPGTCLVLRYSPGSAGSTVQCGGWFEFTEEANT